VWENPCINCQLARFSSTAFSKLILITHTAVYSFMRAVRPTCVTAFFQIICDMKTKCFWRFCTFAFVVWARHPRKYKPVKRRDDIKESRPCFRETQAQLPLWIEKLNVHCSVQRCCWKHLFQRSALLQIKKSVGKLIVVPDILSNSKKWGFSEFCKQALCKLAKSYLNLTAIQQITQFTYY